MLSDPALKHLCVTSLFFQWPEKVGQRGRAWVSHRGRVGGPHTGLINSATLPFSPLVFPFPIPGYNMGPALQFQLKLGRKDSSLQLPS